MLLKMPCPSCELLLKPNRSLQLVQRSQYKTMDLYPPSYCTVKTFPRRQRLSPRKLSAEQRSISERGSLSRSRLRCCVLLTARPETKMEKTYRLCLVHRVDPAVPVLPAVRVLRVGRSLHAVRRVRLVRQVPGSPARPVCRAGRPVRGIRALPSHREVLQQPINTV